MAEPSIAIAVLKALWNAGKYGFKLKKKRSPYMSTVEELRLGVQAEVAKRCDQCKKVLLAAAKGKGDVDVLGWGFDRDKPPPPALDECLRAYLGPRAGEFLGLVRAIDEKIEMISGELDRYDNANGTGREGGNAARRLVHRANTHINAEAYREDIESLRALVSNLTELRKGLEQREPRRASDCRRVPHEYRERSRDAWAWLAIMSREWSCRRNGHARHCLKLLLVSDTQYRQTCLDILIARSPEVPNDQQLCVRASVVLDDPTHAAPELPPPGHGPNQAQSANRAEDGDDLCNWLSAARIPSLSISLGCFRDGLRRFDVFPGHCPKGQPRPHIEGQPKPLCHIFPARRQRSGTLDESLSDQQRFWLASQVVKSALGHRDSPWWPATWTPGGLAFYEWPADELFTMLQTLHLSAELPASPEDVGPYRARPPDESLRRAMDESGIRNLTMWCLGVILLQIALWLRVEWEDADQVRALLSLLAGRQDLGPQYTDAVDRMINWDGEAGMYEEMYDCLCQLEDALDAFRYAKLWDA